MGEKRLQHLVSKRDMANHNPVAIDNLIEESLHDCPAIKDKVSTVLDLKHGIAVNEAAFFLGLGVKSKTKAKVDPAIADLFKAPYSIFMTQGICESLKG